MPLPTYWDNTTVFILGKVFNAVRTQEKFDINLKYGFLAKSKIYDAAVNIVNKLLGSSFSCIRWEGINATNRFYEMAVARNLLLEIGKESEYCLFLDSDVVLPKKAIRKLIGDDKDIVGGVVKIPVIYKDGKSGIELGFGRFMGDFEGVGFSRVMPSILQRVGFINTACMLLSNKVVNDARLRFAVINGKKGFVNAEDHSYCFTANVLGYKVYIDPNVRCEHYRREVNPDRTVGVLKILR